MKFNFQNLFKVEFDEEKNRTVSGPMSPTMAAKELVKADMFPKLDGLARVYFDDPEYNQWYEGAKREQFLTACDTLLLIAYYSNLTAYCLVVDLGYKLCPVALWYSNDEPDSFEITPIYSNRDWAKQLSKENVQYIFQCAEHSDLKPKQPEKA